MQSTKSEILSYCIKKTINTDMTDIEKLSASVLSNDLNISRSLASQYLNAFVKEGVLIKIAIRPVCFLYKKVIEEKFQVLLKENVFLSIEEFMNTISEQVCIKRNFMKMIGYDSSLSKVIDQVKAALKYPNNGLPILIYGEKGTGKLLLCREMYEYAIDSEILNSNNKFCKIKVFLESENILEQLLGVENERGLFEKCNGGIVFIQHAQNLKLKVQQKIAKIIESGVFQRIKTNKNIEFNARIVLSVDEVYYKKMIYDFIQCFPVVCYIPNFKERSLDEKEELVIHLFKKQSLKLRKHLFVSRTTIKMLLMKDYDYNIDELKNIIENLCAKINAASNSENLYIRAFQLPESILKGYKEDFIAEQVDFVDVTSYKKVDESEKMLELFDSVIDYLKNTNYLTGHKISEIISDITQYCNFLLSNYGDFRYQYKDSSIKYILNKVLISYNVTIPLNCFSLFPSYLYLLNSSNEKVQQWHTDRKNDMILCLKKLEKFSPQSKLIVEKIRFAMKNNLGLEFEEMSKIILLINLIYFNNSVNKNKYLCIIIAHGCSTATSMAETANALIGAHVFEAFDMALGTSCIDMAERLKDFINRYSIKNDIILLVDMGSLERLYEHFQIIDNCNIGIINNVSTRMAIEVGQMALKDLDMQTILKKASNNAIAKYTLVENKILKDLIIFISDNGIKMANRMKKLFVKNLPKEIDINVISLEQKDLLKKELMDNLTKEYNILFISGTCTSSNILKPFVSLEDIIFNIDMIRSKIGKHLTAEELDIFSENLIYSFSLESVVDSLSILDAEKLLNFVKEAVNQMQSQSNKRIYGRTIIGLYIHICCMVERLVTKEPIKNCNNIENFEKKHKNFIDIIKKSFYKICQHYGIEIPTSEISYLYDYINCDDKKED
ncbi:sigma 54-interacting transcriptional regulator [Maledivibacter halophilus]|uniref:Transcriptional regulatory protein LevR, contains PRD, AAA+ and EIIA domains n=1 Tax=Maledivibacter halophilus TaxID=36842 RepID=A0A1T5M8F6_9FIRM|nr:sigma 54-interacting transcriptional regulator [Maledivibacter halophilus]SKC84517.1 Transcriptional regulatory protein LevR, contains PRD, AAA+ and EIIA domains [Maledivibacter halophilus]